LGEMMGKPLVAVQVELETAGTPSRHSNITKPQFLVNTLEIINKVEIIEVQALPRVRFQEGFPGSFNLLRSGFAGLVWGVRANP
jgi:hypothetical protein